MSQVACTYAALRFLPYRETGEFANVGVVVWCPAAKVFAYRCNLNLGKRIRGFFPNLDVGFYRKAVLGAQGLLEALQAQFADKMGTGQDVLVNRFHELVRTREGLMTFGPAGALLAESPEIAIEDLYQRLVLRQFTKKPEYQEVVMQRRLGVCLQTWNLLHLYRKDVIVGDDRFHITAPFAHMVGLNPTKILRPLDFDKKDSTGIYKHGDVWVAALRRLKSFNTFPNQVIIPVQLPNAGERLAAAEQVMQDLTILGAQTMSIENVEAVREAAMVA